MKSCLICPKTLFLCSFLGMGLKSVVSTVAAPRSIRAHVSQLKSKGTPHDISPNESVAMVSKTNPLKLEAPNPTQKSRITKKHCVYTIFFCFFFFARIFTFVHVTRVRNTVNIAQIKTCSDEFFEFFGEDFPPVTSSKGIPLAFSLPTRRGD